MKVIVGCEESQAVCIAFRELGHEAYSCDVLPPSGFHPEWHIQDDVLNHLDDGWDLGIFFPPCKYLAWSGERWLKNNPLRMEKRLSAFEFFKKLYNAKIPKKALENSLSWFLRRQFRKEDQLIHPFHFGDPYHKSTCIWKINLPDLVPTSDLTEGKHAVHYMWPSDDRDRLRAKTYPGIARAMAEQWGGDLIRKHGIV